MFINSTPEICHHHLTYKIVEPEKYKGSIEIEERTSVLTFRDQLETVVVQVADTSGHSATYTFSVVGHFPARYAHSSVVLGSEIYITGGRRGGPLNDVWKSTDGGVTWGNVHAAPNAWSAPNAWGAPLAGAAP